MDTYIIRKSGDGFVCIGCSANMPNIYSKGATIEESLRTVIMREFSSETVIDDPYKEYFNGMGESIKPNAYGLLEEKPCNPDDGLIVGIDNCVKYVFNGGWEPMVNKSLDSQSNERTIKIPYKCPVCLGSQNVKKGFYDTSAKIKKTELELEPCRSCKGEGILWGT